MPDFELFFEEMDGEVYLLAPWGGKMVTWGTAAPGGGLRVGEKDRSKLVLCFLKC